LSKIVILRAVYSLCGKFKGLGTGVGQMIVLGSEIKLGGNNVPHYNNVRPFLNRFGTDVPFYLLLL